MTFTVLRRVLVLAAFLLLPLSGCDDIVKKIVGVPGQDAPPTFPDFGVDGDGTVDERLGITGVVPSHGSFTGGQTVKIYRLDPEAPPTDQPPLWLGYVAD